MFMWHSSLSASSWGQGNWVPWLQCVDGVSNFITWKKFRHVEFALHSLWCCWKLGHFLEFSFRPKWLDGCDFGNLPTKNMIWLSIQSIVLASQDKVLGLPLWRVILSVSRRVYPKGAFSGCNWTNRMWAHCASGPENMHMLHLFSVRKLRRVCFKDVYNNESLVFVYMLLNHNLNTNHWGGEPHIFSDP